MKIYKKENVYEAAKQRIRELFNDFDDVVVGFSGGKDSTATLNITLEVAQELGKGPIPVIFIDQEAEWQGTIDYVKEVMKDPRIKPMWFQMPMVITNNASSFERYAMCWDPEAKDKWIHPQDPSSIKENRYGTQRFHELFEAIFRVEFAGRKACYVAGVRTEEAPKRFVALTGSATYKWITWGKKLYAKEEHYTFYPLYDWSYTDVWKYLLDNDISYNKVYDEMYRHGVSVNDMRISNLHHETAIQVLLLVQEIEPQTWNRVTQRIEGANTIKHIQKNSFVTPTILPYMFQSWEEYALHLKDNIIQEEKYKTALDKEISRRNNIYTDQPIRDKFWQTIINTILSSDWDWTKIANWEMSKGPYTYRKFKSGKRDPGMFSGMTFLSTEQITELIEYNSTV
jgi:predicted phosphoadenosine phosphosulfate sulfurtransferase